MLYLYEALNSKDIVNTRVCLKCVPKKVKGFFDCVQRTIYDTKTTHTNKTD